MGDTNENEASGEKIPEIELIIKASTIDGKRKGACLFCQEYFMDLYLLAELKTIALKITTVDMLKPPADFRYQFINRYMFTTPPRFTSFNLSSITLNYSSGPISTRPRLQS